MANTLVLAVTTLDPSQASFYFDSVETEAGYPYDLTQRVSEELSTPGVDGFRYRWINDQPPEFTMATVTALTDYAAAISTCEAMQLAVGRWGRLTVTVGVTQFDIPVQIIGCAASAVPGPVSGTTVVVGAQASARGRWNLKKII
jgi:hypothetical protein